MNRKVENHDQLLTPGEVASLFRVKTRTVTAWNQAGKLSAVRTLGGHRRYREGEVRALLKKRHPSGSTTSMVA